MTDGIRLENVSKTYPPSPQAVLASVSLEVALGEFIALVGASGCGKSTLLRLVAGLEPLCSGLITVGRVPVTGPGADRAMVFQDYSLYPWLNVRDNIGFAGTLSVHAGKDLARLGRRIDMLMEIMGLTRFARHRPGQLSGGMQQRVAIARALLASPRLLLMDEPFGALDAQTREVMHDLLLHLHATEKMTVLFVTHDVEEAIYLASRVVVLAPHPGRIDRDIRSPLPASGDRHPDMKMAPSFLEAKRDILQRIRETSGMTVTGRQLAGLQTGA